MAVTDRVTQSEVVSELRPDADKRRRAGGFAVAVGLAVLVVYWPATGFQFTNWDDTNYVTANELVQKPSLHTAWRFVSEVTSPSTERAVYYHPLTMLSLLFDNTFSDNPKAPDPRPFHQTNILLHAANASLVCWMVFRLFGSILAGVVVGLLFGVHPINVESVAWVASRKTVLSTFFALLTLTAYVSYARGGLRRRYWQSVALFAAALLSKPAVVPLPILLVLLDVWPLRRNVVKTLVEKTPFFVMAIVFVLITLSAQSHTVGDAPEKLVAISDMPALILSQISFYLHRLIYPRHLWTYYPASPASFGSAGAWIWIAEGAILLVVTILLLRRGWGWLIGWLFFLIALGPAFGIVRFTHAMAADRFVYFPMIGLLLLLGAGLAALAGRSAVHRGAISATAGLLLILLTAGWTRSQVRTWQDSVTLWQHALKYEPDSVLVQTNLGLAHLSRHDFEQAAVHYRIGVRLEPDNPLHQMKYADALRGCNRIDESIDHYRRASELEPEATLALYNLGTLLAQQGKLPEAITCLERCAELDPTQFMIWFNLATAYLVDNQPTRAANGFEKAVELNPQSSQAHLGRGEALYKLERYADAMVSLDAALQLEAGNLRAKLLLGDALVRTGQTEKGAQHLHICVQAFPDDPNVLYALACADAQRNRAEAAFQALTRAIDAGFSDLDRLTSDPLLSPLRGDERYDEIVSQIARP